jgi:hypothetical protein
MLGSFLIALVAGHQLQIHLYGRCPPEAFFLTAVKENRFVFRFQELEVREAIRGVA